MGLMGERMSDYDKLVEIIRSYSTEVISYKIDGTFAYAVTAAADAIEKLVKDRNVLQLQNHLERCEHEHTRKERDAAVEEIPKHCGTCRRFFRKVPCLTDDDNCGWEWRGVQEEENGTEV